MLSSSTIAVPPPHSVIQRGQVGCRAPRQPAPRQKHKHRCRGPQHAAAWPAACAAQNTLRLRNAALCQRGRRAFHGAGARVPRHVPGPAAAAGAFRHKRRYRAGPPCRLSFTSSFPQGAQCPASPSLAGPAARFAPKGRLFRIQYNTAARHMSCFDSGFAACYHQGMGIKTRPGR